ncbi:MAG TPA: hypothetical protein VHS55_08090 [Solirubrobacteraceae bacterium]|nr:hypothetical protein [Solirubrobacteraceae bacterium]
MRHYILANAPEYVASMAAADEAIERGEPGVPLADVSHCRQTQTIRR